MNIIPFLIFSFAQFVGESPRQSTVIIDDAGCCAGWIWNDEPGKLNPCVDIPLNADAIWIDIEKDKDNDHTEINRNHQHIPKRSPH